VRIIAQSVKNSSKVFPEDATTKNSKNVYLRLDRLETGWKKWNKRHHFQQVIRLMDTFNLNIHVYNNRSKNKKGFLSGQAEPEKLQEIEASFFLISLKSATGRLIQADDLSHSNGSELFFKNQFFRKIEPMICCLTPNSIVGVKDMKRIMARSYRKRRT